MLCPYRKITETNGNLTIENFGECYGVECPFYIEPYGINEEDCARAREQGGLN